MKCPTHLIASLLLLISHLSPSLRAFPTGQASRPNLTVYPRSRTPNALASYYPSRSVWISFENDFRPLVDVPTIGPTFPLRATIAISGTPIDVPMNLEIGRWAHLRDGLALRAQYGQYRNDYRDQPFYLPCISTPGRPAPIEIRLPWIIALRNEEILNPDFGYGIATQTWGVDPWIVIGQRPVEPYRGPLSFVERLLAHPGFFGPNWILREEVQDVRRRLEYGKAFWEWGPARLRVRVDRIAIQSRGLVTYFESEVGESGQWANAFPRRVDATDAIEECIRAGQRPPETPPERENSPGPDQGSPSDATEPYSWEYKQ